MTEAGDEELTGGVPGFRLIAREVSGETIEDGFEKGLFDGVVLEGNLTEEAFVLGLKLRLGFVRYLLQMQYQHIDLSHVKLLWELLV